MLTQLLNKISQIKKNRIVNKEYKAYCKAKKMRLLINDVIDNHCEIEMSQARAEAMDEPNPYTVNYLKRLQKINYEVLVSYWLELFSKNPMQILEQFDMIQNEVKKRTGLSFELTNEKRYIDQNLSNVYAQPRQQSA